VDGQISMMGHNLNLFLLLGSRDNHSLKLFRPAQFGKESFFILAAIGVLFWQHILLSATKEISFLS